MINRIINNLKGLMSATSPEFMTSLNNRLSDFIDYSQLPLIYQLEYLDIDNLSANLQLLYDNTENIFTSDKSTLILADSYRETGFIASMLMEKYIQYCIVNDLPIPAILYIDTNLLIEDYKKLMDSDSNVDIVHNLNVIQGEIERAYYVIWDKFSMANSEYAKSKLYDILSIRYRRCLNNMFLVNENLDYIQNQLGIEMLNVMNLNSKIVNVSKEKYIHMRNGVQIGK